MYRSHLYRSIDLILIVYKKPLHYGHWTATNGFFFTLSGRFQTVTYVADEKGFRPAVVYEGTAAYPEDKPAYGQPSYSA